MNVEILTKQDIEQLKQELLEEIRKVQPDHKEINKKWLKTNEVCDILKCSPGTLQNLRIQRVIEFTKFGGTLYYSADSINKALEQNKRKVA
jgi:hypothetical protein